MQSPIEKIQNFLSNGLTSLATILKVLIRSKLLASPPFNDQEECFILGNGPSLKTAATKYSRQLKTKKLWAVNYFANSELFEKLQPEYYLLLGPELWREEVRQRNKDMRKIVFDNLIAKTSWPMTVFMPAEAFRSAFLKPYLKKNSQLNFQVFNNTPVEGYRWLNHLFYRWNLGMPRPHNVLIPCILLAINMKFKFVYLVGAEHSWLPTISVNDQNEVLHRNKHFYDTKKVKDHKMYYLGLRPRRLHEILHKFMLAFKGYILLEEYAKTQGVKVYNITPKSFIDAFERKLIEKVLGN